MARIVIDTREQRPYDFNNSITAKLNSGDYSLEGLEDQIAIERKSLDDFINTVLNGKERFRNELTRLLSYDFAAVIIEANPEDIMLHRYKSQVAPTSVFGIIFDYTVRFSPIHFLLAGDRPYARSYTEGLLRMAERIIAVERNPERKIEVA